MKIMKGKQYNHIMFSWTKSLLKYTLRKISHPFELIPFPNSLFPVSFCSLIKYSTLTDTLYQLEGKTTFHSFTSSEDFQS